MSKFEGFREGCPGELQLGEHPYIHTVVHFQADGEVLLPTDAGKKEPDAIRIVPVDDYMASRYQDQVFTFGEDALQAQIARDDSRIPEGNISTIDGGQLEALGRICESCHLTSERVCPVLQAATEMAITSSAQG